MLSSDLVELGFTSPQCFTAFPHSLYLVFTSKLLPHLIHLCTLFIAFVLSCYRISSLAFHCHYCLTASTFLCSRVIKNPSVVLSSFLSIFIFLNSIRAAEAFSRPSIEREEKLASIVCFLFACMKRQCCGRLWRVVHDLRIVSLCKRMRCRLM